MDKGLQTDEVTHRADLPALILSEAESVMDIHKPKPVHNWREFLSEIGIIVIGVLIALAGEQTVEALHHRSQVNELSEALNVELAHNLAVLKDTYELEPCIDQRLKEFQLWSKSVADGRPLQLDGDFGSLPEQIFLTAIWRSTGASLELLPLDKRISYARVYDNFGNVDRIRDGIRDKWKDLASFEGATTLSAHDLLQIAHDIRDIRRANEKLSANYGMVTERLGASLHLVAKKDGESASSSFYMKQRRADFCKSRLAG